MSKAKTPSEETPLTRYTMKLNKQKRQSSTCYSESLTRTKKVKDYLYSVNDGLPSTLLSTITLLKKLLYSMSSSKGEVSYANLQLDYLRVLNHAKGLAHNDPFWLTILDSF